MDFKDYCKGIATRKWQEAVDAGTVSVDAFFDELDSRINGWSETKQAVSKNPIK